MEYVIQKADSSFCPNCGDNVHLLCPKWGSKQESTTTDDGRLPDVAFYICFKCMKVFHVGVGEVTRDSDIN
jgi:hypothetical protein